MKKTWPNIFFCCFLILNINSIHAQSSSTETDETIDPLDNYIDPATNKDYKTVFDEELSNDQKIQLIERCMMFEIQNEMGQQGEASMSVAEIEKFEKLIEDKCSCIRDKHVFEREGTMAGSCKTNLTAEKDLFLHTMDKCVLKLKNSSQSCKTDFTDLCLGDFRYQCYEYITVMSEFQQPSNPILNQCNFSDQTQIIDLECRSYCYTHNKCDVKKEFENKKIGNMYLLEKKSRSSCIKNSTFGVSDDNTIWVDNSCHGNFALQYKEPKCGFRPFCTAEPSSVINIPEQGSQNVKITCNGNEKEDGSAVFCAAFAMEVDEKGVMTDKPDENKEIVRISDVKLVDKIGAAKCNPGGNGSPKDYNSKDLRSSNKGWGIEVRNLCQAKFEIKITWERKSCTFAGEETNYKDTCCNTLIWDKETKTCNVPFYDVAMLPEAAEEFLEGDTCKKVITPAVQAAAAALVAELGAYDQLFSILNDRAEEYFGKIESLQKKAVFDISELKDPHDSRYDLIKKMHLAFWGFKAGIIRVKSEYIKAIEFQESEMEKLNIYFKHVTNNTITGAEKEAVKSNIFYDKESGLINIQGASAESQKLALKLQEAFTSAMNDTLNQFQFEMEEAEQAGLNVTWLCAHKDNCSKKNWLVQNLAKTEIIDFVHDALFLGDGAKGTLLPRIGGVRKTLVQLHKYTEFEEAMKTPDVYLKYFNFQHAKVFEIPLKKPEDRPVVGLFRRFTSEFPLRDKSTLKGSEFESYFESLEGIPRFCDQQEQGLKIRVPLGKALAPMKIIQIVKFLRKYIEQVESIYTDRLAIDNNCFQENTNFGGGQGFDNNGPNINGGGNNNSPDGAEAIAAGPSAPQQQAAATVARFIANFKGSVTTAANQTSSLLGSLTSSLGSGSLAGNSAKNSALGFSELRKKRTIKVEKAIKKRKKTHKDGLIAKFAKSLAKTFSSLLSSDSGSSSKFEGIGAPVGGTEKETKTSDDKNYNNGNGDYQRESGTYSYGGKRSSGNSRDANKFSSSTNPLDNPSGIDDSQKQRMLDGLLNTEQYEVNSEDSIFKIITKRYFKSAIPTFYRKDKKLNRTELEEYGD